MKLLNKGEVVEFVGQVRLTRGPNFLSADRMMSQEKEGTTRAWGNVYMRRDISLENFRWEAWAEEALYETSPSSSSVTLWGRQEPARARRSPLAENGHGWDLSGEEIVYHLQEERILVNNNVRAILSQPLPGKGEDSDVPAR
jgi:lipopolysaccharide export system protein LptA